MTAQHSLAATEARQNARDSAIERIKITMLPGACALAGTRTSASPFWIEVTRSLTGFLPFRGRVELCWRDKGPASPPARRPYDSYGVTYQVQIIVDDDITPMELAELARLAVLYTAEVVREAELLTASQVAKLEYERRDFDSI